MVVARDEDYHSEQAVQKLQDAGFKFTALERRPAREVLARFPNPESVVEDFNNGYKSLDQSTKTLTIPSAALSWMHRSS